MAGNRPAFGRGRSAGRGGMYPTEDDNHCSCSRRCALALPCSRAGGTYCADSGAPLICATIPKRMNSNPNTTARTCSWSGRM